MLWSSWIRYSEMVQSLNIQRSDWFALWYFRYFCMEQKSGRSNRRRGEKLMLQKCGVGDGCCKYLGHLPQANMLESVVVLGKVDGKRSSRRSSIRWMDLIRTVTNRTFAECTRLSQNHERWRDLVYKLGRSWSWCLSRRRHKLMMMKCKNFFKFFHFNVVQTSYLPPS